VRVVDNEDGAVLRSAARTLRAETRNGDLHRSHGAPAGLLSEAVER
jgi:hypothetical protein